MRKGLLKSVFVIILFFFVYNPPISFLPMNSGIMIGGGFFLIYLTTLLKEILFFNNILWNKRVVQVVGLTLFISLYSYFVSIVSGSGDIQVFKSYFSFVLFYLPGAFGIIRWMKRYFTSIEVLQILIIVFVVQSIVILVMLVNPAVKSFLFSLLRDGSARVEKNIASGGFRFLGFAYNTTWDLSIVQSIGVMSIALLFKIDKSHINIKNAIFFMLLSVSVFLTGRTGFFGIVFGLLIIIIPTTINEIPFWRLFKFFGKIFIVIIPVFFLIRSFVPSDVLDIIDKNVLPWAFEMFQNDNGGKLETASSNELQGMYFEPGFKTFFLGDGYYVSPYDNTRYYMDTDAGYMRHILFYGLIGSLIMAIIYSTVFYQMFIFSRAITTSPSVKIFIVLMTIYFFLSHIKGDLFLGSDIPIKALFVYYAIFITYAESKYLTLTDAKYE